MSMGIGIRFTQYLLVLLLVGWLNPAAEDRTPRERLEDRRRRIAENIVAADGAVRRDNGRVFRVKIGENRHARVFAKQLSVFPDLRELEVIWTDIGDESMAAIGRLSGLRTLHLSNCYVTDKGLAELTKLKHLQELSLPNRATDASLKCLSHMKELGSLWCNSTQVKGAGLVHLAELPKLRQLSLHDTLISDDSLTTLSQMPRLQQLYLGGTRLSRKEVEKHFPSQETMKRRRELAGKFPAYPGFRFRLARYMVFLFDRLSDSQGRQVGRRSGVSFKERDPDGAIQKLREAGAKIETNEAGYAISCRWNDGTVSGRDYQSIGLLLKLRDLDLAGSKMPIEDMPRILPVLTRLRRLSLARTNVKDEHLLLLHFPTELRELDLSGTRVTDELLPKLKRLYKLERLNLKGTRITNAAIDELQKASPDCKILE